MSFAHECLPIVIPPFALALMLLVFAVLTGRFFLYSGAGLSLFVGLILLLFFRDPQRSVPAGKDIVVSPADGTVLSVETRDDGTKAISIFLSVFNVHINRIPISGTVEAVNKTSGAYHAAMTDAARNTNARVDVALMSAYGSAGWSQISGAIARKIACRIKPGDTVRTGDRFGLIYFGSRMDVVLPSCAEFAVQPGRKTRAGETIIARMNPTREIK